MLSTRLHTEGAASQTAARSEQCVWLSESLKLPILLEKEVDDGWKAKKSLKKISKNIWRLATKNNKKERGCLPSFLTMHEFASRDHRHGNNTWIAQNLFLSHIFRLVRAIQWRRRQAETQKFTDNFFIPRTELKTKSVFADSSKWCRNLFAN